MFRLLESKYIRLKNVMADTIIIKHIIIVKSKMPRFAPLRIPIITKHLYIIFILLILTFKSDYFFLV